MKYQFELDENDSISIDRNGGFQNGRKLSRVREIAQLRYTVLRCCEKSDNRMRINLFSN